MTFTKLCHSIIGSTIWLEDLATKVVWITLLALTDRDGIVESSVPGLANYAGVNIDEVEMALQKFSSPDPYSRSQEHEGRRIEPVDGGWRVLNYEKYSEKLSAEDIKERARIRQQRRRDRLNVTEKRDDVTEKRDDVTEKRDAGVTKRDKRDMSRMSRHVDVDVDVDVDVKNPPPTPSLKGGGVGYDSLAKSLLKNLGKPGSPSLRRTIGKAIDVKLASVNSVASDAPLETAATVAQWLQERAEDFLKNNCGTKSKSLLTFFAEGLYDDPAAVEGQSADELRMRAEAKVGGRYQ